MIRRDFLTSLFGLVNCGWIPKPNASSVQTSTLEIEKVINSIFKYVGLAEYYTLLSRLSSRVGYRDYRYNRNVYETILCINSTVAIFFKDSDSITERCIELLFSLHSHNKFPNILAEEQLKKATDVFVDEDIYNYFCWEYDGYDFRIHKVNLKPYYEIYKKLNKFNRYSTGLFIACDLKENNCVIQNTLKTILIEDSSKIVVGQL